MYTTIEKVIFLQRVPVFAKVAGEDLVPLARGSSVVALPCGEVIFRQGDPGDALYFIVSGVVALTMDGREIARLGESEVFGELSIFDRELRTVTATVAEDAEVLRVSAEDFHEAVRDTVEIAEAVIKVLQRRLREADRQLLAARARRSIALKPGSNGEPPAEAGPVEPAPAEVVPAVEEPPRAEVDEPNPQE
jgi:CRP-like cAMP-binding protein